MDSWRRNFPIVNKTTQLNKSLELSRMGNFPGVSMNKTKSHIPEMYTGHPMRIERYKQYDQMNADGDINIAMDIIATFCTQTEERTHDLFDFNWIDEPTLDHQDMLREELKKWSRLNSFKKRLWRMVRSTFVYGDQFFIRDPETLRWYWVDPSNVLTISVNDADGKQPTHYVIKDLDPNLQSLAITDPTQYNINMSYGTDLSATAYNNAGSTAGMTGSPSSPVSGNGQHTTYIVDAKHVIHLSLSEGLDANWPFGTSLLESVFQTWRQKSLIADAVIIYRIIRAPERRAFYIDVGGIPAHKSGQYIERIKNEFQARRFAGRTGNSSGMNVQGVDSTYNPQSMTEDFFFAVTDNGRQSRVETLPGGENLGQIDDLLFWTNQMLRQLRVPTIYMPQGPNDTGGVYTDGRVGTAYIQEFNFAKYCERLQNLLIDVFDSEFKLYLSESGYEIPDGLFDLIFNPPQHFSQFAQMERDQAQLSVLQQTVDIPWISKEFALERFGGLTQEEIKKNMMLWIKENIDKVQTGKGGSSSSGFGGGGGGMGGFGGGGPMGGEDPGLNSVGVRDSEMSSDDEDLALDTIPGEDEASSTTSSSSETLPT